jgi:hypothetical protein
MAHDQQVVRVVRTAALGWQIVSAKLRMFVDEMEHTLEQRLDALRSKHARKLEELRSATGKVPVTWEELDGILKTEDLPILMRDAFFLVAFGVFEHHVAHLCRSIVDTGAIGGEGPRRSYLRDSQDYLLKSVKIPAAAFGADWQFADEARNVRNYVAHDAATVLPSDVSAKAQQARGFIEQTDHIWLDGERITLDEPFLRALIDRMDGAFASLDDHVA